MHSRLTHAYAIDSVNEFIISYVYMKSDAWATGKRKDYILTGMLLAPRTFLICV